MVLRPVKTDRAALSKSAGQFKIGDDIDGLGGFVLESEDGSVMMDYRFEGRLREAWDSSLGEVSRILFRDGA
jgi:vacuolar-type H+-ATPase subunit E/Vma4